MEHEWIPTDNLRRRAENAVVKTREDVESLSTDEIQRLVHELQIHQIELELQNEELRRVQAELEETRDRYYDLYDFAPIGYVTLDAKGVIDQSNLAAAHLLGQERARLQGRTFASFLIVQDRELFAEHLRDVRSDRKGRCEVGLRTSDSSRRFLRLDTTSEPFEENAARCRTAITDITDRVHKVELLQKKEQGLQKMIDVMPHIAWIAGPKGEIVKFNQRWLEYARPNILDDLERQLTSAVHPNDRSKLRASTAEAVINGSSVEMELRIYRQDDKRFYWHLLRSVALRLTTDAPISGWIVTCTDIDVGKRAQDALQLADVKKNEFLAMLAHELRNPLAAISSALQVCELVENKDLSKKALSAATRNVSHLSHLIEDLLDVSRISRGEIQLHREVLDIREIVTSAAQVVQPLIVQNRHQFELSLPEQPILVDGDPTRLEQIVTNLLTNSAKYTPPRGQIHCTVQRSQSQPNTVEIITRDNGMGIPKEKQDSVFELFSQLDTPLGGAKSGLGIGLSLVRNLCELHDGSIALESAGLNQGSVFTVFLPMSASTDVLLKPRKPFRRRASVSRRVLIVDDNTDLSQSLVGLLKISGHAASSVADGESAAEAVNEFSPDIVLLDIGLPQMSGYDVAEQLRLQHPEDRPVIVGISGYGQSNDRERGKTAGFDYHLTKPVDYETIFNVIENAFGEKIS